MSMMRWLLAGTIGALFVPALVYGRAGLPSHNPGNFVAQFNPPCSGVTILDSLSVSASAAYSVRKLRAGYAGKAFQIRRDSDNGVLDIGFDSNCYADIAAILSFCNLTNCEIARFYDQSGNAKNVVNGAPSTSPYVVVTGALAASIGTNAKLAFLEQGSQTGALTNTAGGVISLSSGTVYAVANATSGSAGSTSPLQSWWDLRAVIGCASSNANGTSFNFQFVQGGTLYSPPSFLFNRYTGSWLGANTDMFAAVTGYTYGTDQIFSARWNTADSSNRTKAYIGGGTPATDNNATANDGCARLVIGNGGSVHILPFLGTYAEFVTFTTQISTTDANLLGNNEKTYFGLPWTNIP